MSSPRAKPPRNCVVDISSSDSDSSEAVEDPSVLPEEDSDYSQAGEASRLMPKELKKGHYGMFSGTGVPSTPAGRAALSKLRRLRVGRKSTRRDSSENKGSKRKESPLFEPERGSNNISDASDDEKSLVEISPAVSAQSRRQAKRRRTNSSTPRRHQHKQPINTVTLDSESDCDIVPSPGKGRASPHKTSGLRALSRIYADAPLPGNIEILSEYRKVLELFNQQYIIRAGYQAKLREYDEEDAKLAKGIDDLLAEETARKIAITETLAASIRQDMTMTFTSNEQLHMALNQRNAEAEASLQELSRLLAEKKIQIETRREAILNERNEIETKICELESSLRPLVEKKADLEAQGGMLMVFALCQKLTDGGEE